MQTKYKYNINDKDDVELLSRHFRKMENIAEDEMSTIDKIILLTKTMIDRKELGFSIRTFEFNYKLI